MSRLARFRILTWVFAALTVALSAWLGPSILASIRSPLYIPVTGKVVETRVFENTTRSSRVWDVQVRYAYSVNGREYRNRRIQGAQIWQPYPTQAQAEAVAAGYPVGGDIAVYYDPLWPSLSTRTRTPDEWEVMLLMPCMPAVLAILMAAGCHRERRKRRVQT